MSETVLVLGPMDLRRQTGNFVRGVSIIHTLLDVGFEVAAFTTEPNSQPELIEGIQFHSLIDNTPSGLETNPRRFAFSSGTPRILAVTLLKLKRLLSSRKFRFVWILGSGHVAAPSLAALAKVKGLKYVIDQTADSIEWFTRGLEKLPAKFVLMNAAGVTTDSHAYLEYMRASWKVPESRIRILDTRVPVDFFFAPDTIRTNQDRLKRDLGLDSDKIVVHAGRIFQQRMLELIRFLLEQGVGVLVIGPENGYMRELDAIAQANPGLRILPGLPHSCLPDYLRLSDFFVAYYPSTFMNHPIKVVEYLATGKPVVINQFQGLADLVPPDYPYAVPAEGYLRDYQRQIETLLDHKSNREDGRRIQNLTKTRFHPTACRANVTKILLELGLDKH